MNRIDQIKNRPDLEGSYSGGRSQFFGDFKIKDSLYSLDICPVQASSYKQDWKALVVNVKYDGDTLFELLVAQDKDDYYDRMIRAYREYLKMQQDLLSACRHIDCNIQTLWEEKLSDSSPLAQYVLTESFHFMSNYSPGLPQFIASLVQNAYERGIKAGSNKIRNDFKSLMNLEEY